MGAKDVSQTFHITTFGCQMNVNDSSWLAGELRRQGLREASPDDASVIIFNTCSVRAKPEQKVKNALGRIAAQRKANPPLVVVAGCVAQQLGKNLLEENSLVRLVLGTDNLSRGPQAIRMLLDEPGKSMALLDFEKTFVERPLSREAPAPAAYVSIMQGCDNFCSYCIVPFTRGRQKSRSTGAILDECIDLLSRGAREITLLGQNVNAFGKDRHADGESFAGLLRKVAALPGLYRLRYVTPHPKDMTREDIELFAGLPGLCPRLHLPMQSGSDSVLRAMRRRYSRNDFLRLVEDLRKARPDIAFSTDIIVGFPGESEDDFRQTLDMMRECAFVSSFSFCYSDRPGAAACAFPDKIEQKIQSERLLRLQELQDELSQAWLSGRPGMRTEVLVEGPSPRKNEKQTWQGRDPWGNLVHILPDGSKPEDSGIPDGIGLPDDVDYTGHILPCIITESRRHSLLGELVKI